MKLSETIPPDADARRQALDAGRSFIVQAPAGSGKTELLIQRMLALLGVVAQPEEILAMTFTRKAAGEMRARLMRALDEAENPAPQAEHEKTTWKLARAALANDARRGWRLREHPARLAVQTIDSLCASLVRRMPWLSGFGAQAAVTEDAADLYRRAAERTLALAESNDPSGAAARALLAHLDNRVERLRGLLMAMLARRDQWLRHLAGQDAEHQRHTLETGLRSLAEEVLGRLHERLTASQRQALMRLGAFAGGNLLEQGSASRIRHLAGLEDFPQPCGDQLPQWQGLADLLLTTAGTLRKRLDKNCGFPPGKKEPFASMKTAMKELLEDMAMDEALVALLGEARALPPVAYEQEQWRVLQALVTLLPRAVAELWLVFRETGQTDFVQVAQAADLALGSAEAPTDLLLHLDSRIRHILVDEFQDTSWGQYGLVEKLTAGWSPEDGRTLFLVGDPMQSIYRFREAEVGLYLKARRRGIGALRPQPLNLTANFRSQCGIVEWVNNTFPELFPVREDEARGGVRYAPSTAARGALDGPAVTLYPGLGRNDAAAARQVLELVRQARRDDPHGTVAVLVRARTHLPAVLLALRQAGLRFRAQDIDPLAERPVTRDLLALTRALLHPGDRIAALAVLRAPWCGLSLADLDALCGDAPDRTLLELWGRPERLAGLSAGGQQALARVRAVFGEVLARRGRVPLRQLVESAWLALGGPACTDEGGRADAGVVLALLEDLEHGGDLLPYESFADKVSGLYACPDPEADETLQVMTIHKAKGLEFDTVILPGLGRRPRVADAPLMRWQESPDIGLLLAPVAAADGQSRDPIYDAIARLEKEKDDLEVTRLLYVAVTRAKKRLHLLGHAAVGGDRPRPERGSFLEKLWPLVEKRFASLEAPEVPALEQDRPEMALRRLPADWRLPPLPAASDPGVTPVVQPSAAATHEGVMTLAPETEEGRHVGTLVHAWLERIADEGPQNWPVERVRAARADIAHDLGQLGIAADRLERAVEQVVLALERTLASERGRWILSGHRDARCELALAGVLDDQLVHAVIDRAFIDEQGVRWIVDYKTGERGPLEQEDFLASESRRYAKQIALYVRLFQALEPETAVRAALYFPLLDGWIEVA
jgi:ATP-dependent exoDNAse (exonuclease V) beta subunit